MATHRASFACAADNQGELSFEKGTLFHKVEKSAERGWFVASIWPSDERGLIPANYIEELPKGKATAKWQASMPLKQDPPLPEDNKRREKDKEPIPAPDSIPVLPPRNVTTTPSVPALPPRSSATTPIPALPPRSSTTTPALPPRSNTSTPGFPSQSNASTPGLSRSNTSTPALPPRTPPSNEALEPTKIPRKESSTNLFYSENTVDPALRRRYHALFQQHDTNQDGFLSGSQIHSLLEPSAIEKSILATIWHCADRDQDGRLSRQEFCVMMHFVDRVLKQDLERVQRDLESDQGQWHDAYA